MLRSARQLRSAGPRPIGFDLVAVMMLADGLGVSRQLVAEFFPEIEDRMVAGLHAHLAQGEGVVGHG